MTTEAARVVSGCAMASMTANREKMRNIVVSTTSFRSQLRDLSRTRVRTELLHYKISVSGVDKVQSNSIHILSQHNVTAKGRKQTESCL